MKLTSIRLHPFGGVAERTCPLHDGMTVIEGPNEFGKSTLNKALWHALFTPSNLTQTSLKNTMGRWFPKPDGDHARVTLEFTGDGQSWTLKKSWGAGASCSLQATGGTSIVEPETVQARLLKLLRLNQATWQHVLFVNQAELSRTMHDLQKHESELNDVQPFVLGAAAIPGDIAADKLVAAIEQRIKKHFGRWDIDANAPEKGRGIGNRWTNGVGPQLESYYAKEEVLQELDNVVDYENQIDKLNDEIRELDAAIEVDREFVSTGRPLRDRLAKRGGLEEKVKRLGGDGKTLNGVMGEWSGADMVIRTKQEELKRVEHEIGKLDTELANANRRISAEQLKKGYQQLVKARDEWKKTSARLKKSKPIPAETMSKLESLSSEIERLRIKIAAQKLNTTMLSQRSTSVVVTRGTSDPETISVDAGQKWQEKAEGKVRFELDDLQIQVESGTSDVNTLFTNLQTAEGRQSESLVDLELRDFAAVVVADASHKTLAGDEKHLKGLYTAALQDRSEEDWASEVAAVDAIPQTRSVEVLRDELSCAHDQKAKLDADVDHKEQSVKEWAEKYEDLEKLTIKIVDMRTELTTAEKELAGLPPLPDGFDSVSDYLEKLNEKEESQMETQVSLTKLKIQQAELVGAAPNRTAEELRDDLEFKERGFQRQQETGQALLRISSKLKEIVTEREEEDPMKNLEATIARFFNKLTYGRYESVRMAGTAPVEVEGKLTLGTGMLSQGTAGSLALATRLALAELYLDDMNGFLVLDDPFTDMDPDRRRAAQACLGDFSEKRQVILFTCHPEHAAEVVEVAGAIRPEISQ